MYDRQASPFMNRHTLIAIVVLGLVLHLGACTYNPLGADGVSIPIIGSWYVFEETLVRNDTLIEVKPRDTVTFLINHTGLHGKPGVVAAFPGHMRYGSDTIFIHYEANGDLAMTTAAEGHVWNVYPFQSRTLTFRILRDTTLSSGEIERLAHEVRYNRSENQILPNGNTLQCSVVRDIRTLIRFDVDHKPIHVVTTVKELWYNRRMGYPSRILSTTTTTAGSTVNKVVIDRVLFDHKLINHDDGNE
jgi:hypothetical protein